MPPRVCRLGALVALFWTLPGVSYALAESGAVQAPNGIVEPYSPKALVHYQAKPDPSNWPQWRRRMTPGQWYNIPGTSLATAVPRNPVPGHPGNRIGAWNGLAADVRTNRLYTAANGGHADYAGNEVCEIDLSVDEPQWRILRQPTAVEYIVKSSSTRAGKEFHDYYLDGRPASTHTYYALQFLASRNAVFKFGAGSLWGSGNEANWKTDAFSLTNLDWHPAGTWPDVVPGSRRDVVGRSVCIDPTTEEVYVAAPKELRRFDPKSGSYEVLSEWPVSSYAVYKRPCAVDTKRKQVVFFGDGYRGPDGGFIYHITDKKLQQVRFRGPDVAAIVKRDHNFAWYDPANDRFLVKTRNAGDVYAVDAETLSAAAMPTKGSENVPSATNGVHTRWQRLPALGGFAFYPTYRSGIWFLATE